MKSSRSPLLGITFSEHAIHLVVASPNRSGKVQVTQAISVDLPSGLIGEHHVLEPERTAQVLQKLLVQHRITVQKAVIGLPSHALFARQITIPPVLGDVRRAVIRGEIDHLNLLPSTASAFDYISFEQTENSGTPGDPIFFFAAERSVVNEYVALTESVGLKVVAVEPSEYAAVRTVAPKLAAMPLSLTISIGSGNTMLLFYRNGKPIYARRLDLGHAQLIVTEALADADLSPSYAESPQAASATEPVRDSPFSGIGFDPNDIPESLRSDESFFAGPTTFADVPRPEEPPTEEGNAPWDTDRLNRAESSRRMLVQEIGRSLDYFFREKQIDLAGLDMVLLPNNIDLAGMAVYSSALLEMDVSLGNSLEFVEPPAPFARARLQELGIPFAPALGLVLGRFGGSFATAESFDLLTEDVSVVRARRAPKLLRNAALVALGVLATSAGIAEFLAQQDRPVQDNLKSARASLATIQARERSLRTEQNQQLELVHEIRAHNVPWTNVLRVLSQAVPNEMGLTGVTAKETTLTINAETTRRETIKIFSDRLRASGFFTSVQTESTQEDKGVVRLVMSASLPSPDPVPVELPKEGGK